MPLQGTHEVEDDNEMVVEERDQVGQYTIVLRDDIRPIASHELMRL